MHTPVGQWYLGKEYSSTDQNTSSVYPDDPMRLLGEEWSKKEHRWKGKEKKKLGREGARCHTHGGRSASATAFPEQVFSHLGQLWGERKGCEHLAGEGHNTQEWPSRQTKIEPQMSTVPREKEDLTQTKGLSPLSPPALAHVKGNGSLSPVQNDPARHLVP